ncbi:serine protease easter [Aedes aegypti]|uniref:CLIP domain-containing serine protease n=1 Tax=Aedes aegypti TaxID=7159 RepID=A0A1S4F5D9_AEDAE|nr:serine protease easter [Aedes aegypti]
MSQIWLSVTLVLIVGNFVHQVTEAVDQSCIIPHESERGTCVRPQDCPAYQNITIGDALGSVSRLSFAKALQCPTDGESRICCPNRGSYDTPELTVTFPRKRVRRGNSLLRIGGYDSCGGPVFPGKVFGGPIAEIDEFPWAALLFYHDVHHRCGGSVISRTFVITAAHCLAGPSYTRNGPLEMVRLREYNTLSDPDCIVIPTDSGNFEECNEKKLDVLPKSIIVHPDYDPSDVQQYHDIGLIEIENEVDFSDFLQPICLPGTSTSPGSNAGGKRTFEVCGWGRTDFFHDLHGIASPVKLKTKLPFLKPSICNNAYSSQNLQLGPGQICAGGNQGEDSCAGDSGSPLMHNDRKYDVWVLSGIVSRGAVFCGQEGKPGIYTNVEYYLDWISDVVIGGGNRNEE